MSYQSTLKIRDLKEAIDKAQFEGAGDDTAVTISVGEGTNWKLYWVTEFKHYRPGNINSREFSIEAGEEFMY